MSICLFLALGIACGAQLVLDAKHLAAGLAIYGVAATALLIQKIAVEKRAIPPPKLSLRREVVLVTVLLFLCFAARAWRISEVPWGLNNDAAWKGVEAAWIMEGAPYTPYSPHRWGRETLYHYILAFMFRLFGMSLKTLQYTAVLIGMLMCACLYAYGRRIFDKRTALIALALSATSPWLITFSRLGYRAGLTPLAALMLFFFWQRGLQSGRKLDFILGGLSLSLGLNSYASFRLMPLVVIAHIVYLLVRQRQHVRNRWTGIAIFFVTALVTSAPLLAYAIKHPDIYFVRAQFLFVGNKIKQAGSLWPLWDSMYKTLLVFNYEARVGNFFINSLRILSFMPAVILFLGFVDAMVNVGDEKRFLLVMWALLGMGNCFLSVPDAARCLVALPALYLMMALFVGKWCFVVSGYRQWTALGLIMAMVAWNWVGDYEMYFVTMANSAEANYGFAYVQTEIGKRAIKECATKTVYLSTGHFADTNLFLAYPYRGKIISLVNFEPIQFARDIPATIRKSLSRDFKTDRDVIFILEELPQNKEVCALLKEWFPDGVEEQVYSDKMDRRVIYTTYLVTMAGAKSVAPEKTLVPPQGILPKISMLEGGHGSLPGQFNEPRGIASDRDYNVYIADFRNYRIQKFDKDGNYITSWGRGGGSPGQFKDPCGVAAGNDGRVYVADTFNNRVQVFDGKGKFLSHFEGGFFAPRGLAVDGKGRVWVADTGNGKIKIFSSDGKLLNTIGKKGKGRGDFDGPNSIAVDRKGNVYVADAGNRRVQILDRKGNYVSEFPVGGWEGGVFNEPYLDVDLKGDIYLTDPLGHRALRYSRDGKLKGVLTPMEGDAPLLSFPMGIIVEKDGMAIYIVDCRNHRIRKFSKGEFK